MASNTEEDSAKEGWLAVRKVLKAALLADEIPVDTKVMKPKAVYEKFKDRPELQVITYGDKFTRLLRALRKKHIDGDLESEGLKRLEWGKSAAKQVLKKAFREGTISVDYTSARQVWEDFCQGRKEFARLEYNSAFTRRLNSVRDDFMKRASRRDRDRAAFEALKRNHPTPKLNFRGEPQWHGSEAQRLLKEDIRNGLHEGRNKENSLWESRQEYKVYNRRSFRDHIYQEERLIKFQRYVDALRQAKIDKLQY